MGKALTNSEVRRRIGALTTTSDIPWERISLNGLLRALGMLDSQELDHFKDHLEDYETTGRASEYLLGIFAIAAGRQHKSAGRALVFELQPNVVGLVFT